MQKEKHLLFSCLFAFCLTNCFGQFIGGFSSDSPLKGKIDSITIVSTFIEKHTSKSILSDTISKEEYAYNEHRQLIESYYRFYMPTPHVGINSRPVKTIYLYDKAGDLFQSQRYFTTGKPWVKSTYVKNGFVIEARSYYCPDNSQGGFDTLKVNSKGRIIEDDHYDMGGKLYIKTYLKYNTNGQITKRSVNNADGSPTNNFYWAYNSFGDLTEEYSSFDADEKHTYRYDEYDKMHNWLHKIEYINGSPFKSISRKIYYRK